MREISRDYQTIDECYVGFAAESVKQAYKDLVQWIFLAKCVKKHVLPEIADTIKKVTSVGGILTANFLCDLDARDSRRLCEIALKISENAVLPKNLRLYEGIQGLIETKPDGWKRLLVMLTNRTLNTVKRNYEDAKKISEEQNAWQIELKDYFIREQYPICKQMNGEEVYKKAREEAAKKYEKYLEDVKNLVTEKYSYKSYSWRGAYLHAGVAEKDGENDDEEETE